MLEAIQYWQEFWQCQLFFVPLYYLSFNFGNSMVARVSNVLFSLQQNYFLLTTAKTEFLLVVLFSARKKIFAVCGWVGYKFIP
jgi:hypothetical protein